MKTKLNLHLLKSLPLACSAISIAILTTTPALAQQASPSPQFANAFMQGEQATPVDVAIPTLDVQRMLVHSIVSAVNQANLTNDYSVVLKLGSQGFRQRNNEEQMAEQFKAFRDNAVDLNPVLLYQPAWNGSPSIEQDAIRLRGIFNTAPQQVQFDMFFVLEEGRWKLAGVSLGLTSAEQIN